MPSSEIPEFLFPRRLVRGRGVAEGIGQRLRQVPVPAGKVLLVVDQAVHDLGLAKGLSDGLSDAGYEPVLLTEIAAEPDAEVIARGVAVAADAQPVAYIGVGGGSAMDTTKLVAYSMASGTPPHQLSGPVPALPGFKTLVGVPTTVGTGSEATRIAMFAVGGAKRAVACPQFVPDLAVLDSDLVSGLPAQIVASTALDALSHSLESMLSTAGNELSWHFASSAARIIFDRLPSAVNSNDIDSRADLLYASFLAGLALNAGVVLGHSLSYVLAARHGLSHGIGCALALPYCLAYSNTMDQDVSSELAARVIGPGADLHALAGEVSTLIRTVGLPTSLADVGMQLGEENLVAERVVTEYPRPTNPVPLNQQRLTTLIGFMRVGDLQAAWEAMEKTPA